jgi:hypothetical protein
MIILSSLTDHLFFCLRIFKMSVQSSTCSNTGHLFPVEIYLNNLLVEETIEVQVM